jgi:glucosamine 6-phosphate synthetase-like amidotransferase/phosphosugar isomerase protein
MCGLFGFIGESSSPELTQSLATALFLKTQSRGTDASGFYCVETFPKKQIAYYKKPVPAEEFIKSEEYKNIWNINYNLGLFHCRAASVGVGIPAYNENNHPFVSNCLTKALIHNGFIVKSEYEFLKNYYECETECDSEIFLRILEQENEFKENARNFFSYAQNSHYAVAFAETKDNSRDIHLFRNEHRPLVLIDMIESLNQIYFCSTSDIFLEAVDTLDIKLKNIKLYEVPKDCYIHLNLDEKNKINLNKFKINLDDSGKKPDLKYCNIVKSTSDWKNISAGKNIDEIKDFLNKMSDKLYDNANLIRDNIKCNHSILQNKQKINSFFASLRDLNKRCDFILKALGDP